MEDLLYNQCIEWAPEDAKIKIANNAKEMATASFETDPAFIAIEEMLDWTLQGNRIFDKSIQFSVVIV